MGSLPEKVFTHSRAPLVELPNLIEPQLESFKWFVEAGIKDVFKEFSPIADYSDKKFELVFKKYELGQPKCTPEFAKENKLTYDAPLRAPAPRGGPPPAITPASPPRRRNSMSNCIGRSHNARPNSAARPWRSMNGWEKRRRDGRRCGRPWKTLS